MRAIRLWCDDAATGTDIGCRSFALTVGGGNSTLGDIALAELSAGLTCASFFGMCGHIRELDWASPDGKIASVLRAEVEREIYARNHVMHGDWYSGWGNETEGIMPARLGWTSAKLKEGNPLDSQPDLPAQLPEYIEALPRPSREPEIERWVPIPHKGGNCYEMMAQIRCPDTAKLTTQVWGRP